MDIRKRKRKEEKFKVQLHQQSGGWRCLSREKKQKIGQTSCSPVMLTFLDRFIALPSHKQVNKGITSRSSGSPPPSHRTHDNE